MIDKPLPPAATRPLAFGLLFALTYALSEGVRLGLPDRLAYYLPALAFALTAYCAVIAIATAAVDRLDGDDSSSTYAEFGRLFLYLGLPAAAFAVALVGADATRFLEAFASASLRSAAIGSPLLAACWLLAQRGRAVAPAAERPLAAAQKAGAATPRSLSALRIAGTVGAVALLLVLSVVLYLTRAYPDHAREYRLYLTEQRPAFDLAYDEISEEWTEAELKARFPQLRIRCYRNRPGEYLDDRSCFADIGSHNGTPAMNVAFYLKDGKLNHLGIMIPWWAHGATADRLRERFGPPRAAQALPIGGVRLIGWQLGGGQTLFYDRDRPANLVFWNQIFWNSARACREQRCFIER